VLVATAILALSACAFEISGPSEGDAESAGRDYGQTLADTIGARTTDEELETLCGKGAVEEGIVTEGREGDETDNELDAFIAACRKAVSAD
jgi:hypothetical protein